MPRQVTWGTPTRSPHYVALRRRLGFVLPALALGSAALVLLLAAQAAGWRSPLSPGNVSARHGVYDTRCQECHLSRQGAPNVRCLRCHDPASGGRMTNSAHVYFGSLDAERAAAAPDLECAGCHVEHRGRAHALARPDEAHCTGCHADRGQVERPITGFGTHPEFRVLRDGAKQATGIVYSHLTHVTRGRGKAAGYVVLDRKLDGPERTCPECHQPDAATRDFAPISLEDHCLECHKADLNKMDPVEAADVIAPEAVPDELAEVLSLRPEEFERDGRTLVKTRVYHRDPWVLFNLAKLRRELDPEGFAAERAALLAGRSRLERRLALATPTAGQGLDELEAQVLTREREIAYLDARIAAQAQAVDAAAGADRLKELAEMARAAGDEQARAAAALLERAPAAAAGGLAPEEFGARKSELLRVLDAIEKADPERAGQAQELRQRLAELAPGNADAGLPARVREQRQAALARLRDEIALRRSGTAPPSATLLDSQRKTIRLALAAVDEQLRLLDLVPAPRGPLAADAPARKQETVASLTKGCRYCHEVSAAGALARVAAAKPALWRATFTHKDHLTKGETCASCHAGGAGEAQWSVAESGRSSDLSFKGVASCRECHRRGQASQACQHCHDYHPKAVP